MSETKTRMTAEELIKLPDDGKRRELVEGELIEMAPAGARHGRAAMNLGIILGYYVKNERLGAMFAAETGFRLSRDPATVRAPDVAFIRGERIPPEGVPEGYWDLIPDLVAEVVSPNDAAEYVQSKVETWLEAGVRLVWVVYPDAKSIVVHKSLKEISTLTETETLTGGEIVPGFECPVKDLFA